MAKPKLTMRPRPQNIPDDWIDPDCDFDSEAERKFALAWTAWYPDVDLRNQFKFHPKRRFKADFAHLESKTLIDVQGGTWVPGMGHSSGKGINDDMEKSRCAAELGYLMVLIASHDVEDFGKLKQIADIIQNRMGKVG